jgi:hypothetical protein
MEERKRLRTKWLEPTADTANRSNRNERRLAQQLGGKRIPRSGGKSWSNRAGGATGKKTTEGGDVGTKDFHIENKRSVKESIGVKKQWLDDISAAAHRVMKDPALILTFEDELERRPPEDWVAIPIKVFERLRSRNEG